ncbi:MAG: DNA/RNA helicase domain-containing protein [Candidatus Competibacterales bacterium]
MTDSDALWMGSGEALLAEERGAFCTTLATAYHTKYHQRATETQVDAWGDCFAVLQRALGRDDVLATGARRWTLLFEYELPREGGRRPDVVVLGPGVVWVLEFKQKASAPAGDRDQAMAYGRDLAAYHGGCRDVEVVAVLVLTRRREPAPDVPGLKVVTGAGLGALLAAVEGQQSPVDGVAWLAAGYEPLPSLVQGARRVFQDQPLTTLRHAASRGVDGAVSRLQHLLAEAGQGGERHLVLINGVPGSGKTLVGLRTVYEHRPRGDDQARDSVYLTGNDPLVSVLQYALGSRVFVQPIRGFYRHYGSRRDRVPAEHVLVFDEAQRAWDAERMGEKYGLDAAPAAVLTIAEGIEDWAVVVALIGDGQEIHLGEEGGMALWREALAAISVPWQVHCAPRLTALFHDLPQVRVHAEALFDLDRSLRSHLVADAQRWIDEVLAGRIDEAAQLMADLAEGGYRGHLSNDLERAKDYCRQRYNGQPDKRFGLIASSRARNLGRFGVPNGYLATKKLNVGAWFIDPPDSPLSCCQLERAVTEFGCQGLELDMPILAWGDDVRWEGDGWRAATFQRNVKDPRRLRLNSYRVLATRGRDGLVVYVPAEEKMQRTFEVLQRAGLTVLK